MTNTTNRKYGAEILEGTYYTAYDMRLDPEVRDEWIEALLSGEYPQGMRMLVTPEGEFCCLGVYCDVFKVPSIIATREIPGFNGHETRHADVRVFGQTENGLFGTFTFIPSNHAPSLYDRHGNKVGEFFGSEPIADMVAQGKERNFEDGIEPYSLPVSLPDLNDRGLTFVQIADVIRYFL